MSERVHVAFNDNPDYTPSRNWFVSLDGEDWLGVRTDEDEITSDDLRAIPVEEVRKLFAGNGKTVPMRLARRFLSHMMGGTTTFCDDASQP